jgi:hypothetical protein
MNHQSSDQTLVEEISSSILQLKRLGWEMSPLHTIRNSEFLALFPKDLRNFDRLELQVQVESKSSGKPGLMGPPTQLERDFKKMDLLPQARQQDPISGVPDTQELISQLRCGAEGGVAQPPVLNDTTLDQDHPDNLETEIIQTSSQRITRNRLSQIMEPAIPSAADPPLDNETEVAAPIQDEGEQDNIKCPCLVNKVSSSFSIYLLYFELGQNILE